MFVVIFYFELHLGLLSFHCYLQATVFGSRGISHYDFYIEESAEANQQEGAAYPHR